MMHPPAPRTTSGYEPRRRTASAGLAAAVLLLTLIAAPLETQPRVWSPSQAVALPVAPPSDVADDDRVAPVPGPAGESAANEARTDTGDGAGLLRASEQLRDAATRLVAAYETLVERFVFD